MKHKKTIWAFVFLFLIGSVFAEFYKKPDIDLIDRTITEQNIQYYNFRLWTPEEISQIQPVVLSLAKPFQGIDYYSDKIPRGRSGSSEDKYFYKPDTKYYAAEGHLYAKMLELDAPVDTLKHALLGWDALKFDDDKLINVRMPEVMIRRDSKGGVSVEGMKFLKGEVTVSGSIDRYFSGQKEKTFHVGSQYGLKEHRKFTVKFEKGSSFVDKNFAAINIKNPIEISDSCGESETTCIAEKLETKVVREEGTCSFGKICPGRADGDGTIPNTKSIRKKVLSLAPGESENDITVTDGKYDRIDIILESNNQRGPLTLTMKKEDESLSKLLVHNGKLWLPPGEIPTFQSPIVVLAPKLKKIPIPGALYDETTGKAPSSESEVISEVQRIENGEVYVDGKKVSPSSVQTDRVFKKTGKGKKFLR